MTIEEMAEQGLGRWALPLWGPDGSLTFTTPAEAAAQSLDHFLAGLHATHNPETAYGLAVAALYVATGEESYWAVADAMDVPSEIIDELAEVGIPIAWKEGLETAPSDVMDEWRADPGIRDIEASSDHRTRWIQRTSWAMWVRDGLVTGTPPIMARPRQPRVRRARRLARVGSDSDPPSLLRRALWRVARASREIA